MEDSRTKALAIVEILQSIFDLVDYPLDLARCARVNQLWHQVSVSKLWIGPPASEPRPGKIVDTVWRRTPSLDHLLKLSRAPERFRYYMSFVRYFRMWTKPGSRDSFEELCRQELWTTAAFDTINAWYTALHNRDLLSYVVGPSLRALKLNSTCLSDETLKCLQTNGTNIHTLDIVIKTPSRHVLSTDIEIISYPLQLKGVLQPLLSALPWLKHLAIRTEHYDFHHPNRYTNAFDESVVLDICKNHNLELLELVKGEFLRYCDIARLDDAMWPNLRTLYLQCQIPDTGVLKEALVRLKQLRRIKIEPLDSYHVEINAHIILPLSTLHELRSVDVSVSAGVIEEENVIALAEACPSLRVLRLKIRASTRSTSSELSSKTMRSLASLLPRLEELEFNHACEVSIPDLGFIAQHCHNLRKLSLPIQIDLQQLDGEPPSAVFNSATEFGLLRVSFLDSSVTHSPKKLINLTVKNLDRMLRKRAPFLFRIWNLWPDEGIDDVVLKRLNKRLLKKAPEDERKWIDEFSFSSITNDTDSDSGCDSDSDEN